MSAVIIVPLSVAKEEPVPEAVAKLSPMTVAAPRSMD
jgi:hypothetical protein